MREVRPDDVLHPGKLLSKCLVTDTTRHMLSLGWCPEFPMKDMKFLSSYYLDATGPWILKGRGTETWTWEEWPHWILAGAVSMEWMVHGNEAASPGSPQTGSGSLCSCCPVPLSCIFPQLLCLIAGRAAALWRWPPPSQLHLQWGGLPMSH